MSRALSHLPTASDWAELERVDAAEPLVAKAAPTLLEIIRPEARDRWGSLTTRGLTPDRVENILRGALGGNLLAQWELFDLMEDTWSRLKKDLNEVKHAVQSMTWNTVAYSTGKQASPLATKKAEVLKKAILSTRPRIVADENSFEDAIYDSCDAFAKGMSVQETLWELRDGLVLPRAWQWIHPRHYGYPTTGANLMLSIDGGGGDWIEFPENKFLISVFKTKSGHVLGAAMLRSLATFWIGANFAYDWALNLAQMFGLPIRWATYDANVPGLAEKVAEMLETMGSAGWGAFPNGTTLEMKEAISNASNNPQTFLLNLADIAADILILGQTLTTAQGDKGSQALGNVHQAVRADVLEYVGNWCANVFNYQFVPALMLFNFGNNEEDPYLEASNEEAEDPQMMAERDKVLIGDLGMKVVKSWLYDRHAIPLPTATDEIFEAVVPPAPNNTPLPTPGKTKPVPPKPVQAKAAELEAQDKLIANVLESLTGVEARWLGGVKPFFVGLLEMAGSENVTDAEFEMTLAKSVEVFPELFGNLDRQALEDAMNDAMATSLVNGVARGTMRKAAKP